MVLLPVVALAGWGAWAVWGPDPMREVHATLDRRDFQKAGDLLDAHLARHPDDRDARLLAARTARRAGAFDRAAEYLTSDARTNPPNETHKLETALLKVQQGNKVEAERLYAEYATRSRAPDTAYVMEAYLEGILGAVAPDQDSMVDPETGDRAYVAHLHAAADLWLSLRPGPADQAQGLVWKGRIFRYERDHARSVAAFRDALARDPDSFQARFRLALVLGHDAPREALEHLERLHERSPDDRQLRYSLATAHRTLGHAAEARRYLDEMLARDPNELSALVELGSLNLDAGRAAEAETLLRRAHDLAPNIPETNIAMSRCMLLLGKPDEAAKYQTRFDQIEAERKHTAAPKR